MFFVVMLVSGLTFCFKNKNNYSEKSRSKIGICWCLDFNFLCLFFFKYTNFMQTAQISLKLNLTSNVRFRRKIDNENK